MSTRLVQKKSTQVTPAVAGGQSLVRYEGGRLLVAEGDVITTYSADLRPTSKTKTPGIVTSLDAEGTSLLVLCAGGRGFYRRDERDWAPLPGTPWGDESDVFCVNAGHAWFVTRDVTLCAMELRTGAVVRRMPLGKDWTGGSFNLWSGPPGVVAVEVAMDHKIGVASLEGPEKVRELANDDFALGFLGADLVYGGDAAIVRSASSGDVLYEVPGITPTRMAVVAGAMCLLSDGAVHFVKKGKAERAVLAPKRPEAIHNVIGMGSDVALGFEDGTLAVYGVEA